MRPSPIPASALPSRVKDGSYPFLNHRTVAELCEAQGNGSRGWCGHGGRVA